MVIKHCIFLGVCFFERGHVALDMLRRIKKRRAVNKKYYLNHRETLLTKQKERYQLKTAAKQVSPRSEISGSRSLY